MIDISTIDQPIDRMEWKRREELYQRRMAKMERKLVLRSKLMAKPVVESMQCFIPLYSAKYPYF